MVQPLPSAQGAIQFQYLAEIAVGTTARVDLCRATSPPHLAGKLLAVKRLHQHIAEDPAFANQFHDEVWMTAALKHPNVVEVAGWGQDDDGMYLAVELVQGVSLARLMKTIFDTGEAFTERMVVYLASRLCRGLAAAHGLRAQNGELLGLVHRDLTPGNVLIGFNGDVKITDFGLAKAKQRLTKTLTGLLKGQPAYMAPEQARGELIDHRTDLFALGVVMFELFAGRKPWLASSDFDAVQAILTRPPDDLRDVRAKIDRELASVVQRCLEKDPAARFQSANEIQARLDEWLLVHGYQEGNEEALSRFVRRNAMRQMRWFERAVKGDLIEGRPEPPKASAFTGQNPRVDLSAGLDDDDVETESTDVTEVEQMVNEMHQRASDPRAARRIVEESDYSEEVPTIVQKSGALPIKPRAGAAPAPAGKGAARPGIPPAPAAKPAARPPPAPGPRPGVPARPGAPARPPSVPAPPGSPRPPPAQQASAPPPPTTAQRAAAARPTRPDGVLGGRGMHESIIDEDSDARTTAVKARPRRGPGAPPIIYPPQRDSIDSITDTGSEEVPTLPLQGLPPAARGGRAAKALPGQIAPPDPRAPQPPPSFPHLPSLQSLEDDGALRGPLTEERLFAEADRLALEAVRFGDEAKVSAARAERQAMIAKIAGDAAAIAVEAVRIASTAGLADAVRRMEDAHALERTLRRLAAAPLDVPPSVGAPGSSQHVSTAPLPAPSSPGAGAPDPRPSYHPPASMGAHPTTSSMSMPRAIPTGGVPVPPHGMRPDSGSMIPPPPNPQTSGAMAAFEARLRPTIFGLPSVHVAALAIGTFILVLILMWILLG